MTTTKQLFTCVLVLAAVAPAARAATITYATTDLDLGGVTARSPWRTASVAKTNIDGNNITGSDGYLVVGGSQRLQTPVYLWNFDNSASTYAGNGSYALIDDPATTPPGATLLQSGTKNPAPGTNIEAKVFSFDVKAGMPATFRVGVMVDNLDVAGFNANALRVLQTAGGAANSGSIATTSALFNNRTPDWVYFDIAGAQVGDRYEVRAAGGPNTTATAGAFSFDSLGGPTTLNASKLWSVDIQATGGTLMSGVESTYGQGNVWNAFNLQHHPSAVVNPSMSLVSSNGAISPVTFSINGTVSSFNNAGTLKEDYLFFGAGNVTNVHSVDWSVTGLEANATYEMMIYGGAIAGRDFSMTIDTDGDGSLLDETAQNVGSVGTLFPTILADGTGRIIGQAARASGEANWAGFQLRLVSAAVVPEPATLGVWAVVGLVGAALTLRRRRS